MVRLETGSLMIVCNIGQTFLLENLEQLNTFKVNYNKKRKKGEFQAIKSALFTLAAWLLNFLAIHQITKRFPIQRD